MDFLVEPSPCHDAVVTVPGDKSISHRAVMLGSIALGQTAVQGFLSGEDCLATLGAFEQLGVTVKYHDDTSLTVHGVGLNGLASPAGTLDLGNSGTAMRLMAGLMAGQRFSTTLSGDASLNSRPMMRVINPLTEMGAALDSDCDGSPPLQITGGLRLRGISYELPMASAQVKSCVLLAGLYADGSTTVVEPAVTRDHTERMLRTMGVAVNTDGNRISIVGGQQPRATNIDVPADLSSAAFVMLAALLSNKADVLIKAVGINPTRTGVIDILKGMGADIRLLNQRNFGDEPVADIRVRSSDLSGGQIDPGLVSLAIDEFPIIFVAAAAAKGKTTFTGIGELRVKESDRIAAMASGLRALGVDVDESDDGAIVHGASFTAGTVDSFGDHRIAMSLAIAGSVARGPVTVTNIDAVATSFPGFADLMAEIGLAISVESAS